MKAWAIKDWNEVFENAASRKLSRLDYVASPTRKESANRDRLLSTMAGAAAFGHFQAVVQFAATLSCRGILVRSGDPMTITEVALKISVPPAMLKRSWAILSDPKIGWLYEAEYDESALSRSRVWTARTTTDPPPIPHRSATTLADERRTSGVETGGCAANARRNGAPPRARERTHERAGPPTHTDTSTHPPPPPTPPPLPNGVAAGGVAGGGGGGNLHVEREQARLALRASPWPSVSPRKARDIAAAYAPAMIHAAITHGQAMRKAGQNVGGGLLVAWIETGDAAELAAEQAERRTLARARIARQWWDQASHADRGKAAQHFQHAHGRNPEDEAELLEHIGGVLTQPRKEAAP